MLHHGMRSSKLWVSGRARWQHGELRRLRGERGKASPAACTCGCWTPVSVNGARTSRTYRRWLCWDARFPSSCGFSSKTGALPGWPALKTNSPAAMEAAVPWDRAEGPAGPRGSRGCTSRRWRREPGPWPFTTPFRSNRTASPLTALCSPSVRITSYGNMPKGSQSGHILNVYPCLPVI